MIRSPLYSINVMINSMALESYFDYRKPNKLKSAVLYLDTNYGHKEYLNHSSFWSHSFHLAVCSVNSIWLAVLLWVSVWLSACLRPIKCRLAFLYAFLNILPLAK